MAVVKPFEERTFLRRDAAVAVVALSGETRRGHDITKWHDVAYCSAIVCRRNNGKLNVYYSRLQKKTHQHNATGYNFGKNKVNEIIAHLQALHSLKSLVCEDIFVDSVDLFLRVLHECINGAATSANLSNESRFCFVEFYRANEELYANDVYII